MDDLHAVDIFIHQLKLALAVIYDATLVVLDLWLEILDALYKLHQI